jgi:hypothetical protein
MLACISAANILKFMREANFSPYQNGNTPAPLLCTVTCLVGMRRSRRCGAVLLLGKPNDDAGRWDEPPGKMRIDRASEDSEAFIELCARKQLGLCLCRKRLRLTRAPLSQKQAPFSYFKGNVPSLDHCAPRSHQPSQSCCGAAAIGELDSNQAAA